MTTAEHPADRGRPDSVGGLRLSVSASTCPIEPLRSESHPMPSPFVTPQNATPGGSNAPANGGEFKFGDASGRQPNWTPPTPGGAAGPEAMRISTELHERLALGAKMLQALDVQLRRFEGGLAEHDAAARRADAVHREASTRLADLLERSNQACDGFSGRLESLVRNRLDQWERQLAETSQQAVQEVEQRVQQQIQQRDQRLEADAGRIAELEQRLAEMQSSVSEATSRFGEELRRHAEESNRRRDEAAAALRNASAEFVRLLEHADGVRRSLEEDLRQRSELLKRCRELDGQVRGGVEAMLGQVREASEALQSQHDRLAPRSNEAAAVGERLERLLEAMQEWRPLLDHDLPAHLQQRAEAIFEEGSRRFGDQLERVSTAFHSLSHLLGGQWTPGAPDMPPPSQDANGPITPESPSAADDELRG